MSAAVVKHPECVAIPETIGYSCRLSTGVMRVLDGIPLEDVPSYVACPGRLASLGPFNVTELSAARAIVPYLIARLDVGI